MPIGVVKLVGIIKNFKIKWIKNFLGTTTQQWDVRTIVASFPTQLTYVFINGSYTSTTRLYVRFH